LTDDVQVTPSARRTLTTQGFRAVWTTKDGEERTLEGRQVATWEERRGGIVILHEQLFGTITRKGEEVLSIPLASPAVKPEPTIVVAIPQLPGPLPPLPPNPVRPSLPVVPERVATFSSPDWKGGPVYVIHFGSFKDRKRAERHAALLSQETGLPGLAASVDLGAKGVWFRSLLGEFRALSEATRARERLLTERREGIGQVFRMTGVR
jgi:hypothetical protein